MARYDLYDDFYGSSSSPKQSSEERMLNNERKRVEGMIRSYTRNPNAWSDPMLLKLEQLADRYDIPFTMEKASALKKMGVGAVGALDAFLFDLIPDKSYISAATEGAARKGKIAGAIGSFAIPGAGWAKAAGALGKMGAAGKMGSKAMQWTLPGAAQSAKTAAQRMLAPKLAEQGMTGKWITEGVKAASKMEGKAAMNAVNAAMKAGNPAEIAKAIQAMEVSKRGAAVKKAIDSLGYTGQKAKVFENMVGTPQGADLLGKIFGHLGSTGSKNWQTIGGGNAKKIANEMLKKKLISKEQVSEVATMIKDYDSIDDLLMAGMNAVGGGRTPLAGAGMSYGDIAQVAGTGAALPFVTSVDSEIK